MFAKVRIWKDAAGPAAEKLLTCCLRYVARFLVFFPAITVILFVTIGLFFENPNNQ